ncbi:MAG TPA: MCE family protein [Gordonia sp. (in: high G+C Gram-positive bacteria)]|uniref:MCE family protein n=1 Tax=unclassified Gordonia (in: high G+C Gram-positive bacteria) TaxID=2657482 RepID=UPI000FA7D102|nr:MULTISPECIES: MCE family protein [unclassified Gordonia (in: high G+C Gram-positive bacteria)]RUP36955.1 MAG: mammalian cell entry protein [Gordonia sp. (in: high G+C Gram-positive bacteria)]HNP55804.1 MCE family protein [Gordonia sp. (in: high G+C Gram-positive bacteria)]HRC51585.1 MCE family protein [Gordonia sp. (in: high G+C Gram-positive bacteria)]
MSAHGWRLIVVALGGMLLLSGCGVGLQDLPVGGARNTIDVVAQVDTADGVVDGADVISGQQVIGRVTDVALRDGRPELTLSLDKTADLPQNVTATVEIPSALGTPFLRLQSPPSPQGRLQAGATIPADRTSVGPQVEGTLAAMGNVLSGSGMTQLQSVMASLNTAFANRSDKVADLIATLNRLLARSSHYNADFNRAMRAAADATALMASRQQQVEAFLGETPRAVSVLAGQRDRIAALMTQTTNLATNLDAITRGRQDRLNALVPDAAKLVDSLAAFNSGVGATLANMNSFMANFSRAIRGDYLVFDGALDIPGGIDKIITGGLLGSGQPLPTPGEIGDILSGGLWRDRTHPAPTARPKKRGPR